jgi:mannose-1-phosphate guanylyltransferase/mannose-6-phosphate isomerase
MRQVLPFILCGGAGTRLWPLSREAFPKQFHRLTGPETLFQQTCRRLSVAPFGAFTVLANHRHRFLVAEQLEEIDAPAKTIVLEPEGRNTAPAACIAALIASKQDGEALVLLAPADHMIADDATFARAVDSGVPAAEAGALVVFGVAPDCPHTGYGYIETEPGTGADLKVRRFVEKPSLTAAEDYLDSGNFYCNAGLFLFKAATLLNLLQTHAPEIVATCRKSLEDATEDLTFRVLGESYAEAPSISLDYAVAEKAGNLRCVKLDTAWSDVGSWSAVWSVMDKDRAGNVARGEGEIILEDTRDSLAFSDRASVALVGMENVVVVATQDAVLVASKDHAESIKRVVDYLKGHGADLAFHHTRVYRPWGWYQGLDRGDLYQVKCIMVKPVAKLSLQSHSHRSEHWVVVGGTVEVTKGDEVKRLGENESAYIPSARSIASPIPARTRRSSSRSRRGPRSMRTISSDMMTFTAAAQRKRDYRCRRGSVVTSAEIG